MINSLLPKGPIWEPKEGGFYDKLLDGLASGAEYVRADLDDLSEVRNPNTTQVLTDLEREYGFTPNPTNLTEAARRARVSSRKYNLNRNGGLDHLQNALDAAGFDVLVHANDPAVDPAIFLAQAFQMVAGGANAYAGVPGAYASSVGGELLVNGDLVYQIPGFLSQAGSMNAGGENHWAGFGEGVTQVPVQYDIPTSPDDWPLVFFVGGEATRDALTDELTNIDLGSVPNQRKTEFQQLILRIKPIHTWAALIVNYS